MSMSMQGYNITIAEESPTYYYAPIRDGNVSQGWNSSYTGSSMYNANTVAHNGIGTPFRRTQKDGANVTLSFEGTALYLCLTNDGSSYELTVDGNPVTATASPNDPACSNYGGQAEVLAVADGLPYQQHTAVLTALIPTTSASFLFYGGKVTIGFMGPPDSIPSNGTFYSNNDPGWDFAGDNWHNSNDPRDGSSGFRKYNCDYNTESSATFILNDTSIVQLLGDVTNNTYAYTVALDDTSYAYNASNFWLDQQQVLFFAGGLDPTQSHTLVVTNFDVNSPNKPSNASGLAGLSCLDIDGLIAVKSIPSSSTFSLSSNSSNGQMQAGAIAGGVFGVFVAILLLVVGLYWYLCRRRTAHGSAHATFTLDGDNPPVGPETIALPYSNYPDSEYKFASQPSLHAPSIAVAVVGEQPAQPRASLEAQAANPPRKILQVRNASSAVPAGYRKRPGGVQEPARVASPVPIALMPGRSAPPLQGASNTQLVQVLNEFLRREQAENAENLAEEPPEYGND